VAIVLYLSNVVMGTPVESDIYRNVIHTIKNKLLVKYLIDIKSKQIVQRGSVLRRLIVELLSNDLKAK